MTREEAHALLNKLLDGENVSGFRINQALVATGDIEECDPYEAHALTEPA